MNWFTAANYPKLVKQASYDFKNQDAGVNESFGDMQRYVFDAYTIKVYKTKTNKAIRVSALMIHDYLGSVIWSHYAAFDKSEESKATSLLHKWAEATKKLMKKFIDEELPTNLFHSYLRTELTNASDRQNLVKTNIPSINYSYDLHYDADWRTNIYGTRYPGYSEESFKQSLEAEPSQRRDS